MDVDFVYHDAFNLVRPGWKFVKTLDEAGSVFANACKENYQNAVTTNGVEAEDFDGEDADQDEEPEGRLSHRDSQDEDSSREDEEEIAQEEEGLQSDSVNNESDEDEHIIVTRPEDERDPEADAEFDRELAQLMAESASEPRKNERKPLPEISVGLRRAQAGGSTTADVEVPETDDNKVPFSLLQKKGNKQHVSEKIRISGKLLIFAGSRD